MCNCVVFFFQAEDGIRDGHVTGVQTCALPIFPGHRDPRGQVRRGGRSRRLVRQWKLECLRGLRSRLHRSEERRVGKEGRWRWAAGPLAEKHSSQYSNMGWVME